MALDPDRKVSPVYITEAERQSLLDSLDLLEEAANNEIISNTRGRCVWRVCYRQINALRRKLRKPTEKETADGE